MTEPSPDQFTEQPMANEERPPIFRSRLSVDRRGCNRSSDNKMGSLGKLASGISAPTTGELSENRRKTSLTIGCHLSGFALKCSAPKLALAPESSVRVLQKQKRPKNRGLRRCGWPVTPHSSTNRSSTNPHLVGRPSQAVLCP